MGFLLPGDITARMKKNALLDLADEDGDLIADAAALNAAINDAEGIVEAHLVGRYSLPLNSGDLVLTEIGTSLAIARLYLRKNAAPPQHVKEAFDAAMATLLRLSRGEASLGLVQPTGCLPEATVSPADRVFTRETLEEF